MVAYALYLDNGGNSGAGYSGYVFRPAAPRSIRRYRAGGALTAPRSLCRRGSAYSSSSQPFENQYSIVLNLYHRTLLLVKTQKIGALRLDNSSRSYLSPLLTALAVAAARLSTSSFSKMDLR